MKIVIIGFGSIGKKHTETLKELGHGITLISDHYDGQDYKKFKSIEEALASEKFDYIIIAKETYLHAEFIKKIRQQNFKGKFLVEKPLSMNIEEIKDVSIDGLFVAYNLRFHKGIQKIKELLIEEKVLSAHAYVGQHLPSWRPGTDYTQSYSADSSKGGGVLLDLSHEFDYLSYLFGKWKRVLATFDKLSDLRINCEDSFGGLLTFEKCPMVNLSMNLLDHKARREIIINTSKKTIKLDFINSTLEIDSENEKEKIKLETSETYKDMHESILSDIKTEACSGEEGFEVLKLIQAIRQSYQSSKWVSRGSENE